MQSISWACCAILLQAMKLTFRQRVGKAVLLYREKVEQIEPREVHPRHDEIAMMRKDVRQRELRVGDEFPAHIAFVRVWGIYLTRNEAISENDARRCSLERYLRKRCQAGESD